MVADIQLPENIALNVEKVKAKSRDAREWKSFLKNVKRDGSEEEEGGGLHKHWTQEFNHDEP